MKINLDLICGTIKLDGDKRALQELSSLLEDASYENKSEGSMFMAEYIHTLAYGIKEQVTGGGKDD